MGCLHQHTTIALYRLGRNEKLLEIFVQPSNNRLFYTRTEFLNPCILSLVFLHDRCHNIELKSVGTIMRPFIFKTAQKYINYTTTFLKKN